MKKLAIPITVLLPAAAVRLLTGSETAALIVLGISIVFWAVRLIRSYLRAPRAVSDCINHQDD